MILLAVPALPVAVNVAEVATPATLAVTVLVPATIPNVKMLLDRPLVLVAFEELERDPPPPVTTHVTVALGTTLLLESFTIATKALTRALPAVPLCELPLLTAILAAAPAAPVSVKFVVMLVPCTVVVTVLVPLTTPNVNVFEESPFPSVETEELESDPPPEATSQSTVTPETILPLESFTTATRGLARALPAIPV